VEGFGLAQTAAALQRRKVSPVELTLLCIDRIEKLNAKLKVFVTLTAERALADARAREQEKPRGPFHGIPVGLKDLYDTAGVRTTACSRQWDNRVPIADAEAVRRLKAAGAVILGKLNMDEFAYNFTGATSAIGSSRNPWNPELSPGGSSGGSAVAVATGMCFAALGSDTGGSIRLPAALCGVTGFKPSYGLVSTKGVAPLAWSLDHAGPMCGSAQDAVYAMEALTGQPLRIEGVKVRSLRLGVPRGLFYSGLDDEVAKAVAAATEVMAKLSAGAHEVTVPDLPMAKEVPELSETS
jgi:aspartyl-tRNA(Asn)/glutamyl-tRNA(Gln) amidotransferase subunit A